MIITLDVGKFQSISSTKQVKRIRNESLVAKKAASNRLTAVICMNKGRGFSWCGFSLFVGCGVYLQGAFLNVLLFLLSSFFFQRSSQRMRFVYFWFFSVVVVFQFFIVYLLMLSPSAHDMINDQ
jgi:hypothetical protein